MNPGRTRPSARTFAAAALAALLSASVASAVTAPLAAAQPAQPGLVVAQGASAVQVTDRKAVNVVLTPSGQVVSGSVTYPLLFDQLTVSGNGPYMVADPTSTEKLRNLDGFGKPQVQGSTVLVHGTVNGTTSIRLVSEYAARLPVTVRITYHLDGQEIAPADLLGKSGTLTADYVFRNDTGRPTAISFKNGYGRVITRTVDEVTPFVGQFHTTLPGTWTGLVAPHADVAADGHGNNLLTWTLVLFSPIGQPTIRFHYTAQIKNLAAIPAGTLQYVPVPPQNHPEIDTGQVGYQAGEASGAKLASGGLQMDAGVLKLQGGTGQLLAGLTKLYAGANQLSSGLGGRAVPGAAELAAGLSGQAAPGAAKLAAGIKLVGNGLSELADPVTGLPSAVPGIQKLQAGVARLAAGVGSPTTPNTLIWGLTKLDNPTTGLPAAETALKSLDGFVLEIAGFVNAPGKNGILALVAAARQQLGVQHSCQPAATPQIRQACQDLVNIQSLANGVSSTAGLVHEALAVGLPGTPSLEAGTQQAITGVAKLLTGAKEIAGGLKTNPGGQNLTAGLALLAAGIGRAVSGVDQLQAGVVSQAEPGSQKLANGLVTAANGSEQLATGLLPAATGSGEIAHGLGEARAGDVLLHNGTTELHVKGTSQLVRQGNQTAIQYGVEYHEMLLLDRSATAGIPYGAPAGAVATAAYQYTIQGVGPAGSNNGLLLVLALVVLAAAGVLGALLQRRRVPRH